MLLHLLSLYGAFIEVVFVYTMYIVKTTGPMFILHLIWSIEIQSHHPRIQLLIFNCVAAFCSLKFLSLIPLIISNSKNRCYGNAAQFTYTLPEPRLAARTVVWSDRVSLKDVRAPVLLSPGLAVALEGCNGPTRLIHHWISGDNLLWCLHFMIHSRLQRVERDIYTHTPFRAFGLYWLSLSSVVGLAVSAASWQLRQGVHRSA